VPRRGMPATASQTVLWCLPLSTPIPQLIRGKFMGTDRPSTALSRCSCLDHDVVIVALDRGSDTSRQARRISPLRARNADNGQIRRCLSERFRRETSLGVALPASRYDERLGCNRPVAVCQCVGGSDSSNDGAECGRSIRRRDGLNPCTLQSGGRPVGNVD